MKIIIFLLFCYPFFAWSEDKIIHIATFDSGFGGFFTAKEIEKKANKLSRNYEVQFQISHYGDSAHAPYGEKTPDQIATLSSHGIGQAIKDGAENIFIACNTASSQYSAIQGILGFSDETKMISIIESSVTRIKENIARLSKTQKDISILILATPFTVKNMVYPKAIAKSFDLDFKVPEYQTRKIPRWYKAKGNEIENITTFTKLVLPKNISINIYQLGPGNWVDMIEHGADDKIKRSAISSDLAELKAKIKFDIVGEFCTHYPVFDVDIRKELLKTNHSTPQTQFIVQGPLMAEIFENMYKPKLKARPQPLDQKALDRIKSKTRPVIFISGNNKQETKDLSWAVFKEQAEITIKAFSK